MISIKSYQKPSSLEEAYGLLVKDKKATLIGGGAFLKLGSKNISTAIDLSNLGLDTIEMNDEDIVIGAMVNFHQLETDPGLNDFCGGIVSKSVKDIVGIQMRNMVTVGATVYSRYGFSDLITGLLALEAEVLLYKQGAVDLASFLEDGAEEKDILTGVRIKKTAGWGTFTSMRKSRADYAVLNVAVSDTEKGIRIAVGARPNRGILAEKAMAFLNSHERTEKNIDMAADILADELVFGSNMRATAEYRKSIAPVLFKRALEEVLNHED